MSEVTSAIPTLLRQPLLHFLLAGAAIFALDAYRGESGSGNDKRIVVSSAHIARLADQWQMTRGRQPTDDEIQILVRNYIKEEIYYREAVKLGLDVNDSVIRQRLGRKIEFLLVPELTLDEVSEEALAEYFGQHIDRYVTSPIVSFEQVYFAGGDLGDYVNENKLSEPALTSDSFALPESIEVALEQLRKGAIAESVGDVIGLPSRLEEADRAKVTRTFGKVFFDALLSLQPDVWTGPVVSGFGIHLVKITHRQESYTPSLSEVRAAVVNDWLSEQNSLLQNKAYDDLRSDYDVIIDVSAK
ncbi:MAG: peptidyl-prolyl cis-trans isomerase [Gammaproteobacteria bacterium]